MSNDGTQPPSIAPKKTPGGRPSRPSTKAVSGRGGSRSTTRPVTGAVSGSTAPSTGERIKRTGAIVTEAPSDGSSESSSASDAAAIDDLEMTRRRPLSAAEASAKSSGPITDAPAAKPSAAAAPAPAPAATPAPAAVPAAPAAIPLVPPARDEAPARETPVRQTPSVTTKASAAGGPRKVRLAVSRIDPWSIMKLSFLLSVAIGIMIVVAAAVVWYTLDNLAVFTSLNDTISEITGKKDFIPVLEIASFDRVISLATMIAVVDVVILTALSTIGAFLYNIVAALVGGINVTLTDD